MEPNKLDRFLKAQETDFHTALAELSNGRKQRHWMWYIFPQILGLGFSDTAIFYVIPFINNTFCHCGRCGPCF